MGRIVLAVVAIVTLGAALQTGCAPSGAVQLAPTAPLRLDGARILATEREFVALHPNRASGEPNSARAAEWLRVRFTSISPDTRIDTWEVSRLHRPLRLRNVVCRVPGDDPREVVIVAHHDQSPLTVEGADNDGSGIGVLLELARTLSTEGRPARTLVFVASDAEEYGMLGARRFVATHEDPSRIVAAVSLDNLGKSFYGGVDIEAIGQFRGVGPLWLQKLAGDASRASGNPWPPTVRSPLDQMLGQAVPISFMDEGPFVAEGVPAIGLTGAVPVDARERHWESYHTPHDTTALQSAATLERTGRAAEALVRQLIALPALPEERGPYVYFADHDQVLRGAPLWSLLAAVPIGFALLAARAGKPDRPALVQLVRLWLPLLGGLAALYAMVATGVMDQWPLYPATARELSTYQPRWPAVAVFLAILALGFLATRRWRGATRPAPVRSVAFGALCLVALYFLAVNPMAVLLLAPTLAWAGIGGRGGRAAAWFVVGASPALALLYVFGFTVQRIGFGILWYVLQMFALREVDPMTAAALLLAFAAGLSLLTAASTDQSERSAENQGQNSPGSEPA